MHDLNLAIVDVETTGANPQKDRVIEVGVLLVSGGQISGKYSWLVNPETKLNPFISQLTGIGEHELFDAPQFREIAEELYELLEDRVFVAHFAKFDFNFLKNEFKRVGKDFSLPQLCSIKLSKLLYPQYRSHGLSKIIERFGFECDARHRALGDAEAVWKLFEKARQDFSSEKLQKACKLILQRPSIPAYLDAAKLQSIPNCPGVYIFLDAQERPLYVGKSNQLKKRVLSHFYAGSESKELAIAQHIRDVKVIPAAGELHALLRESALVKTTLPLYNRQLRKQTGMYVLRTQPNHLGYEQLDCSRVHHLSGREVANVVGVFRSRQSAMDTVRHLQEDHQLCWKLCGLEQGQGACFGHHLGQCSGACVGKVHVVEYNQLLSTALARVRIADWPFSGRITITEENEQFSIAATHYFDHWCYLGSVSHGENDTIPPASQTPLFDLDMYRILNNYLKKKQNLRRVHECAE